MLLRQVDEWVDAELPRLNQAILDGAIPPGSLAGQAREVLLPRLPSITRLSRDEARRLVVRLGFLGASVARHYQEWTPGGKELPERAFDGLPAGSDEIPFRHYFAALAEHTGDGHYGRDSYASLVRWNVGTIEVRRGDEVLSVLPGVFDDRHVRSYTGTSGEERFFVLVKQGEAIELAVNEVLEPLTHDGAGLVGEHAVCRVRLAADLMMALRKLFLDFAVLPPERSMPPEQFMDVFRQFAVHWTVGDIPPSGALDPEALKRDFLLGIAIPGYEHNVRRLFPALLSRERTTIEDLMARDTLPFRLLTGLGIDPGELRAAPPARLRQLLGEDPALADWYRLLTAHARAAGAHLMLSKKFLFKPQRRRDEAGAGDRRLVSNRSGTTGMNETYLERLTRARQDHPLAPLRAVVADFPQINRCDGVRSHPELISVALVG
ncbi:hypothetical protein [Actinoplanes sp. TBRC 11911]|uniref:hypothetical protein n=1 Tax=Actinoplanes sp. TBRC 11911 TaxID=2729386 RepID=UPI001B7D66BB|nr:hypothetical protein [Actinoplanes sp. TBRC 11911]